MANMGDEVAYDRIAKDGVKVTKLKANQPNKGQ